MFKEYKEKCKWISKVDFNYLIGDTIKERTNSVLLKIIEVTNLLGGHDDSAVIACQETVLNLLLNCRLWGEKYDIEDDIFLEGFIPYGEIELTSQQIYKSEDITLNDFLIIKAVKWDSGIPVKFDYGLLTVDNLDILNKL